MKRILILLAISLMALGSIASADLLVSDVFLKFFSAMQWRAAGKSLRQELGWAYKDAVLIGLEEGGPGLRAAGQALSDNGYVILKANAKTETAFTIRDIPARTDQFRWANIAAKAMGLGKYSTESGEFEFSIVSKASLRDARLIAESEGQKLGDLDMGVALTRSLQLDERLNRAVEAELITLHPEDINLGFTKALKLQNGEYVVIRSIRVNAGKVSANEMGSLIKRVKLEVLSDTGYGRFVNP